jgi:hypothetical protein
VNAKQCQAIKVNLKNLGNFGQLFQTSPPTPHHSRQDRPGRMIPPWAVSWDLPMEGSIVVVNPGEPGCWVVARFGVPDGGGGGFLPAVAVVPRSRRLPPGIGTQGLVRVPGWQDGRVVGLRGALGWYRRRIHRAGWLLGYAINRSHFGGGAFTWRSLSGSGRRLASLCVPRG